jgi:hypothetical protein
MWLTNEKKQNKRRWGLAGLRRPIFSLISFIAIILVGSESVPHEHVYANTHYWIAMRIIVQLILVFGLFVCQNSEFRSSLSTSSRSKPFSSSSPPRLTRRLNTLLRPAPGNCPY